VKMLTADEIAAGYVAEYAAAAAAGVLRRDLDPKARQAAYFAGIAAHRAALAATAPRSPEYWAIIFGAERAERAAFNTEHAAYIAARAA